MTAQQPQSGDPAAPPLIAIDAASWDAALHTGRHQLEALLPDYLRPRRWFGAKARAIAAARIGELITLPFGAAHALLTMVGVTYHDGPAETYLLPLAYAEGPQLARLLVEAPERVIARLQLRPNTEPGLIYDPLGEPAFAVAMLDLIRAGGRLPGAAGGELAGSPTAALPALVAGGAGLEPHVLRGEQSNSSVRFGDQLIMKLYRKLEPGVNPDLELGRFLTEERGFANTPPLAGAIEYLRPGAEPMTIALLQGFVPNRGNARSDALAMVARSFDVALAHGERTPPAAAATIAALLDAPAAPPEEHADMLAGALDAAALLGRRTAELHLVLASGTTPAFAPEAFTPDYQQALARAIGAAVARALQGLRALLPGLPAEVRPDAARAAASEGELLRRIGRLDTAPIRALRTRTHGDYHLEQVLYTGRDYMIIDFEGEPVLPIGERRLKRSPLRDVAGMLRSYEYAAYGALFSRLEAAATPPADAARLRRCADFWAFWAGAAFLRGYLATAGGAPFLPAARGDLETLLEVFVLEKAVYEISYEMNNRPGWLGIPLSGLLRQVSG